MSGQRKMTHLPVVRTAARGARQPSGIRITNVTSIRPPDPDTTRREEDTLRAQRKMTLLPVVRAAAGGARQATGSRVNNVTSVHSPDPDPAKREDDSLRAQLQKEIVLRSRTCAHSRYACPLPVASGRAYCPRHILGDPTAPYTRCRHERCNMPARLAQDPEQQLCFEHARAALYARQRAAAPPPPVASTETLLNQLQHYVKPERVRTTSCTSSVSVVSEPADQEILPHAVDPFKQIDATAVNQAYSSSIMEWLSASDSDADSITIDGTEPGGDSSDPEEAPAEEAPLWRAGVYTAEEAVWCALSTLRSLQSAYSAQCARLRHTLATARAQYLHTLKHQREQYCSINSQSLSGPLTVVERRQLRKLKAYAGYRRRLGAHAVLARKLHHKRAKARDGTSSTRPPPSGSRCTFAEGGVRCGAHSLPAARHCLKHISHDTTQVLFLPCGDMRGGVPCREPCARLPLPSLACRYHTDPPHYTVFTLKKDDSDSESHSDTSLDSQITHCEDEIPPAVETQEIAAFT